jgi:hypothetical protein
MSLHRQRLLVALALAFLILSACNLPRESTPTESGSSLIYTAAAETVNAQLTLANQPPGTPFVAATFTPPGFPPSATPPPPTAIPASGTPIPTATSVPCDRATFVKDVNFPDNTQVKAGESFVKTWRLENAGSCTWTTAYNLVFAGGDQMGAPAAVPLTGNVSPGGTIDLSVTLKAPDDGGTYRGEFKLRNASNVIFGVGNQDKPFWVQIKVPVATGLLFDFLVKADAATWTSGIGNDPGSALAYEGAVDDANGAARIMDQVKLETGAISGKILLMFPRHDDSGFVTGLFPAYKVQTGDHLRARLGFMIPSGDSCGSGKVRFQIYYKEGDGELRLLDQWTKSCNRSLQPIDLDLSALKGKEVRLAFTVRAEGSFTDDWAIWNSPRIEH